VGSHQLWGLEVNPHAAEHTRVTICIGEIQLMIRDGFGYARDPILKPLENVETRDALIDRTDPAQPKEADWPDADVTIGNKAGPLKLGHGDVQLGVLGVVGHRGQSGCGCFIPRLSRRSPPGPVPSGTALRREEDSQLVLTADSPKVLDISTSMVGRH
jgi:hypothetical protein